MESPISVVAPSYGDSSLFTPAVIRMLPKNCQMLLFSATFEETVWNFAKRIVPDPNIIKLKREEETLDTIKQYYVSCNSKEEKFQALCNIYGAITIAQAMIFCHVRDLKQCMRWINTLSLRQKYQHANIFLQIM